MSVSVLWSAAFNDDTGLLTITYASGGYAAETFPHKPVKIMAHPTNNNLIQIGTGPPYTELKVANCTSPIANGREDLIEQLKLLFFKRDFVYEGDAATGVTVEDVVLNDGAVSAVNTLGVTTVNATTVNATLVSTTNADISTRFTLAETATAPTTDVVAGTVYADDGTNTTETTAGLRYYNGSAWEDIAFITARTAWTPGIDGASSGSVAGGTPYGSYWVIGNILFFQGRADWSSTTANGQLRFTIPGVNPATISNGTYAVNFGYWSGITTTTTLTGSGSQSSSTLYFVVRDLPTSTTPLTHTTLSASGAIYFSGFYVV